MITEKLAYSEQNLWSIDQGTVYTLLANFMHGQFVMYLINNNYYKISLLQKLKLFWPFYFSNSFVFFCWLYYIILCLLEYLQYLFTCYFQTWNFWILCTTNNQYSVKSTGWAWHDQCHSESVIIPRIFWRVEANVYGRTSPYLFVSVLNFFWLVVVFSHKFFVSSTVADQWFFQ